MELQVGRSKVSVELLFHFIKVSLVQIYFTMLQAILSSASILGKTGSVQVHVQVVCTKSGKSTTA